MCAGQVKFVLPMWLLKEGGSHLLATTATADGDPSLSMTGSPNNSSNNVELGLGASCLTHSAIITNAIPNTLLITGTTDADATYVCILYLGNIIGLFLVDDSVL